MLPKDISIDEAVSELGAIVLKAEIAMENEDSLMNTDLCLPRFDELFRMISNSVDEGDKERNSIMIKENDIKRELEELRQSQRLLKSVLESFTAYKPRYPKKVKVLLFSL